MSAFASLKLELIVSRRDDKRYTEKKNKSERARRKKEDIAKLRNIVDLALRYGSVYLHAFHR